MYILKVSTCFYVSIFTLVLSKKFCNLYFHLSKYYLKKEIAFDIVLKHM